MKKTGENKQCSRCKNVFPATLEHFQRDASMLDGMTHRCKGCRSANRKRHYWSDPDKWREKGRQYHYRRAEQSA